MNDLELDLLNHYRKLHGDLSEMIESGRLSEPDIPDDYEYLVYMLLGANHLEEEIQRREKEEISQ